MDRLVSTEWLEEQLGAPDLRILDCTVTFRYLPEGGIDLRSGREAWREGHIPGARHVDLLGELSDPSSSILLMLPSAEQFSAVMGRLGIGEGTRVVLYDAQINMWAARVWWMLRAYGFDETAVLDGGWQAWSQEGRPVARGEEPEAVEASFVARPRPNLLVGKDEVLAALGASDVVIVNALDAEAHRGDRQDYARAGHIPGARNVPFSQLVDPDTHRFLPVEQLRERFAHVLAGGPEQVITYCGAAIAASGDAFALGLLGLEDVSVYDGSMLEWAADPSLPLVTGD